MTCPEERVVAFLAGELSGEEERKFDEHLLGCEPCWRAVQADRAGRLALEQLREPAPPGLRGRVTLALALAAEEGSHGNRVRRRVTETSRSMSFVRSHLRPIAAVSLLIAMGAGAFGWFAAEGGSASEPPQVAAVVAMMSPRTAPTKALRDGEHLVIGHQHVAVRAYILDGIETIVATSTQPFTMPPSSHLLAGSSSKAWMATSGALSMYGVNRSGGKESMFLVARMPMAELPEVAVHLHLI